MPALLRDRELARDQQVHISKIIIRSQDSLLEIVNNILEIEKLQSGTPILLERSAFDLALLTSFCGRNFGCTCSGKEYPIAL